MARHRESNDDEEEEEAQAAPERQRDFGEKLSKGGPHDYHKGPVKDRSCTDGFFCGLFVVHLIVLLVFLILSQNNGGNPKR